MRNSYLPVHLPTILTLTLTTLVVFVGCSKPHTIVRDLESPLHSDAFCNVGKIDIAMGKFVNEKAIPTAVQINILKGSLRELMNDSKTFATLLGNDPAANYEVQGTIHEFNESGWLKKLLLFWLPGAGESKLRIELLLVERESGQIVFAMMLQHIVGQYDVPNNALFYGVARDFVKAIEDSNDRLVFMNR